MRQFFLDALSVVLTAGVPIVAAYFIRILGIEKDAKAVTVIQNAAQNAADTAYKWVAENGMSITSERDAVNEEIAIAASRAQVRIPDAMKRLDVSSNQFREIVEGKFGAALAADPNVSVAGIPIGAKEGP